MTAKKKFPHVIREFLTLEDEGRLDDAFAMLDQHPQIFSSGPDVYALLKACCLGGNVITLAGLIARGADVNSIDPEEFMENRPVVAAIHAPVAARPALVGMLIQNGCELDWGLPGASKVCVPLQHAIQVGCLETIKLLVLAGGSLNSRDAEGRTCMDWANISASDEIKKYLRCKGALTSAEVRARETEKK